MTELNLYNEVLNSDCIETIIKYLDPMDIVNLGRARFIKLKYAKKFREWFNLSIGRNIDNWFKNYFGKDYDEFRSIMVKCGGVLSGSFVIQMILGENWPESDIDIFFPMKDFDRSTNHFHDMETFLYKNSTIYENEEEGKAPSIRYVDTFDHKINAIHEYEVKHQPNQMNFKKFQVVGLDLSYSGAIAHLLSKYIDIDICKNFFSYTQNDYNLTIVHLSSLINKRIIMKNMHIENVDARMICSGLKRYMKYKNRGFTFDNDNDIVNWKKLHDKSKTISPVDETIITCKCSMTIPVL